MFRRDSASCITRRSCVELKPYCQQPLVHEILHIKCPIIKLVRHQIDHAENRLCDTYNVCRGRNTWKSKLWKNRWILLSLLLTIMLMISLFIYGAIVGAGLCSSAISHQVSPCPRSFSLFPGFTLTKHMSTSIS